MLSFIIDAKEGYDMDIIDITGAYINADTEVEVEMKLELITYHNFTNIDPIRYQKSTREKNRKQVMYCRPKKESCGTLQATQLFYKRLMVNLKVWVFDLNQYESGTSNKFTDGTKCTIMWHVDDMKILHANRKVLYSVIKIFNDDYGKYKPLTEKYGKAHNYLGMKIDYRNKLNVRVAIYSYINIMLMELKEDFVGTVCNSAP